MSAAEQGFIQAADGVSLRCALWCAQTPQAALLLVHGVASHLDWYRPLAEDLQSRGITTFIVDRRGTGSSGGARGHAPSAAALVDDVARAAAHLSAKVRGVPWHLAGVSLGALIATTAVVHKAVSPSSLLLVTPAFGLARPLTRLQRLHVRVLSALVPRANLRLPYDAKSVARTSDWQTALDADPLRLRSITARLARITLDMQAEVLAYSSNLHLPVLLQLAGADRVVDNALARSFFAQVRGSGACEEYEGAPHGLPLSLAQGRLEAALAAWILEGYRRAGRASEHVERDATALLRRPGRA